MTEEPDAVIPHVRICMGALWVTGRPTITMINGQHANGWYGMLRIYW
ncbi:MAG: hypothetical protein GY777_22970 [Candidatus Brocadiaceae bacterium]|nr:hypothetical protein [Candidatus Brocadiaceae bacterium]